MNNDPRLFQRAAAGDDLAYYQLFQACVPKLSKSIHPYTRQILHETEDIIQDVYIQAWKNRAALANISSLAALENFFFIVARNMILSIIRREKAIPSWHDSYYNNIDDAPSDPAQALQLKQFEASAQRAIDSLSVPLREAYILWYKEGLTTDEIAARLGLSGEAARKRVYLAREQIRAYLHDRGELIVLCMLLGLTWKAGLA